MPNNISQITGQFIYRKFDPREQIDESCKILNGGNFSDVPRYNRVSWVDPSGAVTILGIPAEDIIQQKVNFFFPSDLQSEFITLTTPDSKIISDQKHKISDSSTGSKLEYLLGKIAGDDYTKEIEQNIDSAEAVIPVVDPTSKKPVESVTISRRYQKPDVQLLGKQGNKILRTSFNSPFGSKEYSKQFGKADKVAKKQQSRVNPDYQRLNTLEYSTVSLKEQTQVSLFTKSRDANSTFEDWTKIGYAILKYRFKGEQLEFMYSRFIESTELQDPYVAYGKTYRYVIKPVYAKFSDFEDSGAPYQTFVMCASNESAHVDVECKELRIPNSPIEVSFEYLFDGNIKVFWKKPSNRVEDRGEEIFETNDIKGYQLFLRNSLEEPYRLYRYFSFNNTVPSELRIRPAESIKDDYIISSEYEINDISEQATIPDFFEYTEYVLKLRANTDYFVAICSIDAHGNSSNYSAQYKIRRDNVTGRVAIKLISVSGAPKQYPNLYVKGRLLNPSFTASGYKYMDVYYCPDTEVSVPEYGVTPSLNIQLFDLETQIEQNVGIKLSKKTK